MKTAEEMVKHIIAYLEMTAKSGSMVMEKDLVCFLADFEKEIRKDERENRIKELTSMGEFKTNAEAQEYCRLHGLDIHTTIGNVFRIAGALMDARKDQDKVMRYACAESVNKIDVLSTSSSSDKINDAISASRLLFKTEAHQAIMNVKTI